MLYQNVSKWTYGCPWYITGAATWLRKTLEAHILINYNAGNLVDYL